MFAYFLISIRFLPIKTEENLVRYRFRKSSDRSTWGNRIVSVTNPETTWRHGVIGCKIDRKNRPERSYVNCEKVEGLANFMS